MGTASKNIAKGVRPQESTKETVVSVAIVLGLVLIAIGVYRAQEKLNLAVLALHEIRNSAEKKISAPDAGQAAFFSPPEGFSSLSPPETFDRATLSDKIDGKAELYLPAGFQSLFAQRFTSEKTPDLWHEAFFYDMGGTLNAFSVYSAQRRDDARAEKFARFAYSTDNALFWVHGNYYAEIIASEAAPETGEQLAALAQAFNDQKPADAKPIEEIALFPEEAMAPHSISYLPANVFGFEGLDKVFVARYLVGEGGEEATAFISRRNSAEEARQKADDFIGFMLMFGGVDASEAIDVPGAKLVDFLGTFDAAVARGEYLLGVHEAPNAEAASALLKKLLDGTHGQERYRGRAGKEE